MWTLSLRQSGSKKQRLGLGEDFLNDVEAAFDEICRAPNACPTLQIAGVDLKLDLRWTSLGRFADLTIFHVAGDEILVVAVLNAHRDLESILRSRVGLR